MRFGYLDFIFQNNMVSNLKNVIVYHSISNCVSFTDKNDYVLQSLITNSANTPGRRKRDVTITSFMPFNGISMNLLFNINDDVFENTESFQVAITYSSNVNVGIGMNNKATVNIEDDEMITVFFQEDSYSFSESDGEAVVTVHADLPPGGLAVNITLGVSITDGTAISKKLIIYVAILLCCYKYKCANSISSTYSISMTYCRSR